MARDKAEGKQYRITGFQTDPKGNKSGDMISFPMRAVDISTAHKEGKAQVNAILGGQSSTYVEEVEECCNAGKTE